MRAGASISLVMRVLCALALSAVICFGQSSTRPPNPKPWIRGTVVSDRTGEPLTRARVLLRSVSGEAADVAVECDSHGRFSIANVIPGKYSISAERDGYLPSSVARQAGSRMPAVIIVESGQNLGDITVKLTPWSVIAGRIHFSDAEPAIGVLVQVYHNRSLADVRASASPPSHVPTIAANTGWQGSHRVTTMWRPRTIVHCRLR